MAKKKTHGFKVILKAPATQKQADAIQLKPCYVRHLVHYNANETLKEFSFFFEGSHDELEAVRSKLSKLKSKNISVGRISKI